MTEATEQAKALAIEAGASEGVPAIEGASSVFLVVSTYASGTEHVAATSLDEARAWGLARFIAANGAVRVDAHPLV